MKVKNKPISFSYYQLKNDKTGEIMFEIVWVYGLGK